MNPEFNDMLKSLEHPPIKLLRSHADHVRAVWNDLTLAASRPVLPPRCTLQEDGNVTFEWSRKNAYIGIDIAVREWTWFAIDRNVNCFDGSDNYKSANDSLAGLLAYIEKFAVTQESA